MLNKIIEFSIRQKVITGVFTLALIAFGGYYFTKLPIDAVPDITNNQVQIITVSPSLGAPDVERLITFQLEMACSNIPDLIEMRSFSRFGLSLVTLVFKDKKDIYLARQQVAERLLIAKEKIPSALGNPELGPVTTGLGEIYQYVVRPLAGYEKKYDISSLRSIQDWIVRRQLLGVEGVADVSSFGGKLKQYEVVVEPAKLQANNISIQEVFEALNNNNQNAGGAYIEKGPNVVFIRTEGLLKSIEDIEKIAVKTLTSGMPLRISDIAEVKTASAVRYGAMVYNNTGEVAGAVVMMLKGANSNQVIKRVKERIEQIKKTLPQGVTIEAFLDRTKMVNNAINTVKTNLIEGALIVVFVLVIFLGNIRAGLLVASVIPLSMLFAVIMMHIFGVSGNLMSLGALDFGLIVDGAVIIVEAVMHRFHTPEFYGNNFGVKQNNIDNLVKTESKKLLNSTVFAQAIILIVYLPLLTLEGIEGKMFLPMAQTVSFALIGAFILSLTYVPMMSALVLKVTVKQNIGFSEKLIQKITTVYIKMLNKAINYSRIILTATLILFTGSLLLFTQLGGEFIPELEEGDFAVDTRVLTGSNLQISIQSAIKSADVLLKNFPEVEKVVSKIGSGEIPTDPMPIEAQDLMVILKDKKSWVSAKTFNELAGKMNEKLNEIPGVTYGFQYPVQMRFNELMTGARQDVVCKIFGEDLNELTRYAKQLGKIIQTVNGAENLFIEPIAGLPQIVITYKRDKLALYGLNITDVNNTVNTAFAGGDAGNVYEGEKQFKLVVRMNENYRRNEQDVGNLLIKTGSGAYVPISEVADVTITEGPNQIQREDAKRRIVVGFNVGNRDVASVVEELQLKVDRHLKMQPGYFIKYGGAFENLQHAKSRLMIAVPVALLLIFFMLYLTFRSIRMAILIYTAIPLSATGGIIALYLRDMPFSISAGVGFIALFGVAVLNGIVLIAEFKRQMQLNENNKVKTVIAGTKTRLRPVLMTAAVASLGFLPMALSNGAGAEVQRPLATVVIGGLLIATLLTLFVLPLLYILFADKSIKITNSLIVFLFVILMGYSNSLSSQTIKLNDAIDAAIKNNLQIKEKILDVKYKETLTKTAWNLPKTMIDFEYGQINSFYNDNRLSIKQNFDLPAVYIKNKQWLVSDLNLSKSETELKTADIKKQLNELYAQYALLLQKEKLIRQLDSLYKNAEEIMQLRLVNGAINKTEHTIIKTKSIKINQQLKQLINDRQNLMLYFNLLIGSADNLLPQVDGEFLLTLNDGDLTDDINDNLNVKHALKLHKAAEAKYKLINAAILPELILGYNTQTIYGIGNDERFYNYQTRFNIFTAGIAIPLFFNSYNNKIKAYKMQSKAAEFNYKFEIDRNNVLIKQSQNSYQQYLISYNNLKILNNEANALILTAMLKLKTGEIDLLSFLVITENAIDIINDKITTAHNLNKSIIEIYYLKNKL